MTAAAETRSELRFLDRTQFDGLIALLIADGYQVVGPTIDQGAIVYGEIRSVSDLPVGWTDVQEPGRYRLERREDGAWFGYVVGPHSWKRYLFPPVSIVAAADRHVERNDAAAASTDGAAGATAGGESVWTFHTPQDAAPRYAFLGVRACELAAMRIQDRVFLGGAYTDPIYQKRRESALIIAVNCTQAAATCFCTSMNTGPRCTAAFDLALTELADGFLMEAGSQPGCDLLDRLPTLTASPEQRELGERVRQQAVDQITKQMNTDGIRDLLSGNLSHSRWNDVANRCLSCTNCTMVCPTCFCSSVQEVTDLTGDHTERERRWDSCFNPDFSYMNGGIVRNGIRSRYRQWLTHKLSSWHDQFGTSGCVGCGRCITWCPVGIDLTEEVAAIRIPDGPRNADSPDNTPPVFDSEVRE